MKKLKTSTLPDETARSTFISLMSVFGAAQQLIKDRMRSEELEGLGPLHLRLLCLCEEQPGSTQQQLAVLMGRDKGQVAHLLHALESKDLLCRTPDAQDRRLLRMSLTSSGSLQVQNFKALETQLAQYLFAALPVEEVQQLNATSLLLQERAKVAQANT